MKVIEFPKNSGIKIRVKTNRTGGKSYGKSFQIDIPSSINNGKRSQKLFKTQTAAKEYCQNIFDQYKIAGQGLLGLTDSERSEVQIAVQKLRNAGISITEAIEYAIPKLKIRAFDMLFSDLIAKYSAWKRDEFNSGVIGEIGFKNSNTKSDLILKRHGDVNLADITRDSIKQLFIGFKLSYRTKENYYHHLGTLMRYATNEGYLEKNPMDSITDTDKRMMLGRKPRDVGEVNILSVNDTQLLLETALLNIDMGLLPCLVVQLFCGVRATESTRLKWSDIKYETEKPYINISRAISKGRYVRHTEEIPPNALHWLSLCDKSKPFGFSEPKRYDNQLITLKQKCGFGEWIKVKGKKSRWKVRQGMKNVLRHSFGSYHYELNGNPNSTARAMGHKYGNDDLLFKHYREAVRKGEGKKYFNIRPKPSKKKVILITKVA